MKNIVCIIIVLSINLYSFSQSKSSLKATGRDTLIFSDLTKCLPRSAISFSAEKYQWRAVKLETADKKCGNYMLMADPEAEVPEITLKLNTQGWYSIFLGLYRIYPGDGIRVKLSNDKTTTFVQADNNYDVVEEVFWKHANVTGQDIIFKQVSNQQGSSYIAYVKLVPLSDKQVDSINQDINNPYFKRLIALNDGHGIFYAKRPTDVEEITEDIEPYKNTDFDRIYWCVGAGGDVFTFPSRTGKMYGEGLKVFPRKGDRDIYESLQILNSKGINTLSTVIDYAHSINLKIYLSIRIEAFMHNPPWDGIFNGYFYDNFPQYRCKDIDGSEIARMSLAYPEVQDFIISIIDELLDYRPDGISILFNRGAPYVLYEEPVVNDFIKRYGKDPRKLAEDDTTFIDFRSEYITNFMRRLRKHIDRKSIKLGMNEKFKISAHALNDYKQNRFFGLDVKTWSKEGLVDEIVAYPWNDLPLDVDWYVANVDSSKTKLYVEMMPRRMTPEQYRSKAIELYNKGVYGLSFWDTNSRHTRLKQWSIIRRLGHKDMLKQWDDGNGSLFRVIKIKKINNYRTDKYSPGDCY